MINLSKLCDAADWFDSEFQQVVKHELKEFPRFHRKQWEFAMIFLALRKLGYLNEESTGLSMGGGNERVVQDGIVLVQMTRMNLLKLVNRLKLMNKK